MRYELGCFIQPKSIDGVEDAEIRCLIKRLEAMLARSDAGYTIERLDLKTGARPHHSVHVNEAYRNTGR